MKYFIPNPLSPRRPAWEHQIKVMLGLGPKEKLPLEGLPEQVVHGITLWVAAAVPKLAISRSTGQTIKVKSSTHRVMCKCPGCGRVMGIGRLAQHRCKDPKKAVTVVTVELPGLDPTLAQGLVQMALNEWRTTREAADYITLRYWHMDEEFRARRAERLAKELAALAESSLDATTIFVPNR